MGRVGEDEGARLGERLRVAGFQPLPDVSAHGELIGTRLWRLRDGYVEYVTLRANGVGHAVRAEASYDYRYPFDHGPIIDDRLGYVGAAVDWLLGSSSDSDAAPGAEPIHEPPQGRPYLTPPPPGIHRLRGNDPRDGDPR